MITRRQVGNSILAAAACLLMARTAHAEEVLKWAHVYEITEPFHTESVWAGEEIAKRTGGLAIRDLRAAGHSPRDLLK